MVACIYQLWRSFNMSHNKILWKSIVFLFLFVSGVFFIFSRASAASTVDWPSKAIRIVVPFPPGGNTDIVGRVLAEQLGQKLSVPVLVENRPGATGFIGTNYVIGQPSDGYTFLLSTISITISPHIYTSIPDDILSLLTPVSMVTTVPKVLVVRPGLPVSTVSELVEYAKEKNEPLTYGSSGIGSAHHLSGELFKLHYDVDLTHIPYKGGAPALNDLIGERIDIVFDDVPPAH